MIIVEQQPSKSTVLSSYELFKIFERRNSIPRLWQKGFMFVYLCLSYCKKKTDCTHFTHVLNKLFAYDISVYIKSLIDFVAIKCTKCINININDTSESIID